jgi:SAM-dependent methyltransferase
MNWKTRAALMKVCSRLPASESLYKEIQRRFGRLNGDPKKRLPEAIQVASAISRFRNFQGSRILEIGTGNTPRLPLLLHIMGAGEIVTCDIHKRLDPKIALETAQMIAADSQEYGRLLAIPSAAPNDVSARAEQLNGSTISEVLHQANIVYLAPLDATQTGFPAHTFDVVYSVAVLEHVNRVVLLDILKETARILAPGGIAVHLIDLSDHFAHTDPAITAVNFLQYSDHRWRQIAGNQFAYHNRLREPEYVGLFRQAGLRLLSWRTGTDGAALEQIQEGRLSVDAQFSSYTPDTLATVEIEAVASPSTVTA